MAWLIFKYLVTAAIVVLVSELARRNPRWGALVAALPLVTLLAMTWMHLEQQPAQTISSHAYYTFWFVLPSLPMFLLFPWLNGALGFWAALAVSAMITVLAFVLLALGLRGLGIELWPT